MTERDANGKFVAGNQVAKGNRGGGRLPKEREERFYEILISTVTFERWKKIVLKAAEQAERGDSTARKFIADYSIGVPVQKLEHSGPDGGPLTWKQFIEGKNE